MNKDKAAKIGLEESKQVAEAGTNNNNVVDSSTITANEEEEEEERENRLSREITRTPFADLSLEDADLALARTLQEQERAYMMLTMNQDGVHYGSWDAVGYFHDDLDDYRDVNEEDGNENGESEYEEEDVFDAHARPQSREEYNSPTLEIDPAAYSSDEAYATALQEAEEREMAARLMALAGINDRELADTGEYDHGGDSLHSWDEVDPDELSYEELLALGEVIGTESRGLSADKIASLPCVSYKGGSIQSGSSDSCVICRLEYEDDETLTLLSCKHSYHPDCINNWLKINKVCPVCSAEVSTSGNSLSILRY